MTACRKSPRLVALLIYALLLNLVGQAAAVAHRLADAGTWCGAATFASTDTTDPEQEARAHAACVFVCGASVAMAGPEHTTVALLVVVPVSLVALTHGHPPTMNAAPWRARGPPVV